MRTREWAAMGPSAGPAASQRPDRRADRRLRAPRRGRAPEEGAACPGNAGASMALLWGGRPACRAPNRRALPTPFPHLPSRFSAPVVAMVWEGKNVVLTGRKIIGATNPLASEPGTIR